MLDNVKAACAAPEPSQATSLSAAASASGTSVVSERCLGGDGAPCGSDGGTFLDSGADSNQGSLPPIGLVSGIVGSVVLVVTIAVVGFVMRRKSTRKRGGLGGRKQTLKELLTAHQKDFLVSIPSEAISDANVQPIALDKSDIVIECTPSLNPTSSTSQISTSGEKFKPEGISQFYFNNFSNRGSADLVLFPVRNNEPHPMESNEIYTRAPASTTDPTGSLQSSLKPMESLRLNIITQAQSFRPSNTVENTEIPLGVCGTSRMIDYMDPVPQPLPSYRPRSQIYAEVIDAAMVRVASLAVPAVVVSTEADVALDGAMKPDDFASTATDIDAFIHEPILINQEMLFETASMLPMSPGWLSSDLVQWLSKDIDTVTEGSEEPAGERYSRSFPSSNPFSKED
ncbi:hypothetical protein HDU97_003996 [Phlyctochytrium planicorne]|nr:hypothetical protein HDU97_003996 [Phlyctochytrium planicorne]